MDDARCCTQENEKNTAPEGRSDDRIGSESGLKIRNLFTNKKFMRPAIFTFLILLLMCGNAIAQKKGKKHAHHAKHHSKREARASRRAPRKDIVLPDDEAIGLRIQNMESAVPTRYDGYVKERLRFYLNHKSTVERMAGLSVMYFPIFDEQLRKNNLPQDLKYLTIVESQLQPRALSRAGAGGLWQFMRGTAQLFDLRVDGVVDERADPIKSSEAAAKYLKKLYEIYGDWELVLAAYNSGTGKVAYAMKRARSNSFKAIQRFLPSETQRYIPNFIAASYIMQHYTLHGFKPQLPELDLQLTTNAKIFNYLTLQQVADYTGLSRATIEMLNPFYKAGYIPASEAGNNLLIPRRVLTTLMDHIGRPDSPTANDINSEPVKANELPAAGEDENYMKSTYVVQEGDNMETLAEWFNCHAYNILMWNNLSSTALEKDQELTIYIPRTKPGKKV